MFWMIPASWLVSIAASGAVAFVLITGASLLR
jgi:hypothetical protein